MVETASLNFCRKYTNAKNNTGGFYSIAVWARRSNVCFYDRDANDTCH